MKNYYYVVVGLLALLLMISVAVPVEAFQTAPTDGAMNVRIDGNIVIDFDDSMRVGTVIVDITPDMVYPMEKRWSNDDRTLTLTPMAGFINEQTYTVNVIGTNITGNVTDQTFSFATEAAPGIMESLSDFFYGMYAGFIGSLYGILIFLVLIMVGFVVAWVVKKVTYKILDKSPLDEAMKKVGVEKDVQKIGIKSVSSLISQLMFWFIFVMFIQIALD
ncbi:MAG: Ig-like domain-containing protein, partial [Thermoplasmata archaeon]|nr:Ig-like domain-containing protein [Thermoplasmata archaeon]